MRGRIGIHVGVVNVFDMQCQTFAVSDLLKSSGFG